MRNFNSGKDEQIKKADIIRLHRYPAGVRGDDEPAGTGEIAEKGFFCGDCGARLESRFCKQCGKDSGVERYMTDDEIAERDRQSKLRDQARREYEVDKEKRKKTKMSSKDKDAIKEYKKQLRDSEK